MSQTDHVGPLLKHISKCVEQRLTEKALQLDLTSTQLFTLHFLCVNDGKEIFQKDIEDHFELSHATVSGIIARLESKGFIVSLPSEQDRRFKKLAVTTRAKECDNNMREYIMNTENELLTGFSESETELLFSFLHRIVNNIQIKDKLDEKEAD